jgi:hypothetical protein
MYMHTIVITMPIISLPIACEVLSLYQRFRVAAILP